jgi:hypothetical protein
MVNMAEVSSAGDNDVQHLVESKCKSSDIACIKCKELENKLQETLLELSSAKLIIKLLKRNRHDRSSSMYDKA